MIDRSSRARIYVAALVVASLLLPVRPGRADSSPPASSLPALYVNYTMNCTFTMTDDAGKTLTSVAPGNYQILVTSPVPFAAVDLSGINDMTACKGFAQFALSGPGVSVTTTMDNGDSDNAVLYATFAPSSTYTAVDNIQPAVAHFSFTTTAADAARAAERPDDGGDDDHARRLRPSRAGAAPRRRHRRRRRAAPTGARSPRRSAAAVRSPSPTRGRQ